MVGEFNVPGVYKNCGRSKIEEKQPQDQSVQHGDLFQFRKNNQVGEGQMLKILRSNDNWCLVSSTEEYFKKLKEVRSGINSSVIPKILKRKTKELSVFSQQSGNRQLLQEEF